MMDKRKIFKEVQKQLSKGNIDKAISLWEDYVRNHPDGNIYNTIGDLYLRKRDKNKAIEYFHKAAELFVKEGFSTKAQALYKKILHVNPYDAKALTLTGDLYSEKGLLHEAVKFYLASIEALAKENKKEEISSVCQKIINLAPDNTSLRNKLAQYLQKEGFIEEASKEYMLIGKIFLERADDENALEFLEKAYELYPKNKEIYPLLINLYLSINEKEKAEKLLKQASELFPDDIGIKISMANLLKEENKLTEALELINEVLTISDLSEDIEIQALKLRAEIQKSLGNTEQATDDFLLTAEKLIQKDRYDEAEQLLLTAKEISPMKVLESLVDLYKLAGQNKKLVRSLIELADLKASSGQKEEALELYQEASVIAPEEPEIKTKIQKLTAETSQDQQLQEEKEEAQTAAEEEEEKSLSEKLLDADIYIRYGLTIEAIELLEKLKLEDPQNIEVHKRLKNLYLEVNNKEKAITECLALAKIMEAKGNVQEKEKYISEALDIDPSDPRLTEFTRQTVEASTTASTTEEFLGTSIQGLESFEKEEVSTEPDSSPKEEALTEQEIDYSEEISEAEFYFRQGLYEDALNIYKKLAQLHPEDKNIKEKIEEIQKTMSGQATVTNLKEEAFSTPDSSTIDSEKDSFIETPDASLSQQKVSEKEKLEEDESTLEEAFQNIFTTEEIKTLIEKESPKVEPELEEDVFEIFEEFKKGISQEVSEEDYETHYNLGIAYKEMGLIDDAIKEFQIAKNSPEKKVHVLSMLGLCYMEKGLYNLAAETFEEALKNMDSQDDTYWSIKFDLAEAYEKMGEKDKALSLYTEIYGWDSKFRAVNEKINTLKGHGPEVILEKDQEQQKDKPKKKNKISYL